MEIFVVRLTFTLCMQSAVCYPSGAHEFTPGFSVVRDTRSLVVYVMFCRSLFVLLYFFLGVIVLFVLLWFTDSESPFSIFKLFLFHICIASHVFAICFDIRFSCEIVSRKMCYYVLNSHVYVTGCQPVSLIPSRKSMLSMAPLTFIKDYFSLFCCSI